MNDLDVRRLMCERLNSRLVAPAVVAMCAIVLEAARGNAAEPSALIPEPAT